MLSRKPYNVTPDSPGDRISESEAGASKKYAVARRNLERPESSAV
jgi:hypothetical protein